MSPIDSQVMERSCAWLKPRKRDMAVDAGCDKARLQMD